MTDLPRFSYYCPICMNVQQLTWKQISAHQDWHGEQRQQTDPLAGTPLGGPK